MAGTAQGFSSILSDALTMRDSSEIPFDSSEDYNPTWSPEHAHCSPALLSSRECRHKDDRRKPDPLRDEVRGRELFLQLFKPALSNGTFYGDWNGLYVSVLPNGAHVTIEPLKSVTTEELNF